MSVTTANAARRNSTSENVIDSENMIKLAPDTANSKGARKAAKKAKPARVPRQRPVLVGPFLIASRSDGKRSRGNADGRGSARRSPPKRNDF